MVLLRDNFAGILAPGVFEVVKATYDRWEEQYKKCVNLTTSKKRKETTLTIANSDAVAQKNEGAPTQYTDYQQGYTKDHTHITYSGGMRVTRELYDDDLYGVIKDLADTLGVSMRQAMEVAAANIYNRGFSGSYTGPDTVALFSLSHPLKNGSTDQNMLTTAADLSDTSLRNSITQMRKTVDDASLKVMVIPKTLLVPVDLAWDASVILESQLKSGTANNDKNVLKDLDLGYTVNNFLTDTDAWFILGRMHKIYMWMRMNPKPAADDDFDTGDAKFKLTARWVTGWSDWRGTFGTAGA